MIESSIHSIPTKSRIQELDRKFDHTALLLPSTHHPTPLRFLLDDAGAESTCLVRVDDGREGSHCSYTHSALRSSIQHLDRPLQGLLHLLKATLGHHSSARLTNPSLPNLHRALENTIEVCTRCVSVHLRCLSSKCVSNRPSRSIHPTLRRSILIQHSLLSGWAESASQPLHPRTAC